MVPKDEDNVQLGLRQQGQCLYRVALRAPSSSFHTWLELMNEHFPRLEDIFLLCTTTDDLSLVLPENFQAPGLRRLALHGIGLPKGLSLLSSTIALSTLTLTHTGASCYLPPRHLVTQLQGLPHLEELNFSFAIPMPFPSNEEGPLPAPIPSVTLPALRRLTFRGVGVYLDSVVAQINTPLLERLSLTLFFELEIIALPVNLTKFIQRTGRERLGCLVARVMFNKGGASIYAGNYKEQPCDWQIKFCNAGLLCPWECRATRVYSDASVPFRPVRSMILSQKDFSTSHITFSLNFSSTITF